MKAIWYLIRSQQRFDRFYFWIGLLVALVPAAAGLLLLGVSGWFITAAAIAGLTGTFLNIFAPSAVIRALAIFRTAGRYGERMLTHDATFRFLGDLRNRLFARQAAKLRHGQRSALALNRLTADIAALDTVYLRLVVPLCLCAVVTCGLLLIWSTVSLVVLGIGCVCLSAWALLAARSVTAADRNSARRAEAASDAMRLRAADLASARMDLAIYGGLDAEGERVLAAGNRLRDAQDRLELRVTRLTGVSNLIGQLFLALMLCVCAYGAASGALGLPQAVGLVLVVIALPELISMTLPGLANLPRTVLAAQRAYAGGALADRPALVPRTASGQALQLDATARSQTAAAATDALTFDHVSFAYPGAGRPVLDDLSFQIRPGELVALSGRSGCGKSTVAALAARMRRPDQGSIRLMGEDVAHLEEALLREKVTVVSQRAYLFNETIAANLKIAAPNASDADLWQALEKAALAARVAGSPLGLATVLGEGGLGFSGGEQRRLALARAFLTYPDLFILDEMTEGLDEDTAQDVLACFLAHRNGAAVLLIAHKARELEIADRVIALEAQGSAVRSPRLS